MLEQLQDRAEQAVAGALAAGASGAFAWATRNRSVDFNWRDGRLDSTNESTSNGLSIEIYADGRYSSHSTTDLRREQLAAFLRDAVALTRALQPDTYRALPDPALYATPTQLDLKLTDPAVTSLDVAQRRAWVEEMEAGVRGAPEVVSATSWVSTSEGLTAACSSNGFFGTQTGTNAWMGVDVTLKDGDGRPEEGAWSGGIGLSALRAPADLAAEALSRGRARLGEARGPTTKTTLIVDNRAGGRLFGALLRSANARSVQQGRSFWASRKGQPVLPTWLSLTDDPLLPGGLASRPFDNEGLRPQRLPILADGALQNFYVDTYYGRKAGLTPTTGSPSNQVLGLGDRDQAALQRAYDAFIESLTSPPAR